MDTPVHNKEEIVRRLNVRWQDLNTLGAERLGLFGSFVRDAQHESSDVDILVEFRQGEKTFDHFMVLAALLEELFQHRTELVTRESLSPYIGPHILKEVVYVEAGT